MKTIDKMLSYSFKYLISTFKCLYHWANASDFGTGKRRHVLSLLEFKCVCPDLYQGDFNGCRSFGFIVL
jgi:hypothetical protein